MSYSYSSVFQLYTWTFLQRQGYSCIKESDATIRKALICRILWNIWCQFVWWIQSLLLMPFPRKSFLFKIAFSGLQLLLKTEHFFSFEECKQEMLGWYNHTIKYNLDVLILFWTMIYFLLVLVCCLVPWTTRILKFFVKHAYSKCLVSIVLAEESLLPFRITSWSSVELLLMTNSDFSVSSAYGCWCAGMVLICISSFMGRRMTSLFLTRWLWPQFPWHLGQCCWVQTQYLIDNY